MNKEEHEYKKWTSVGSGIALAASGAAAFTTAAPVLTGVFIGTAALSSTIAAYNWYRKMKEDNEDGKHSEGDTLRESSNDG